MEIGFRLAGLISGRLLRKVLFFFVVVLMKDSENGEGEKEGLNGVP